MTPSAVSEVEARFSKLRRSLDDGGYMESFGSDSLRLVEHLYNDLVETTDSLQKSLVEYAHYKKIAEELENGVLPFKEENVRLSKENSQLRIGIARAFEDAEDKARDPLSRLRELEDENNDLKLLVSQFAERVKKAEIDSLEKSKRIIKLQEKDLTPSVISAESAERGRKVMTQRQTMEIDYFVPEACPQCIRLRNYVEYGKSSDRNPKAVDYIKLSDSRIEALQLQLRSLKNTEKEHVSVITSLKTRVDTRDSEIEKLRSLIKVRPGGVSDRNGKGDRNCEIELKSAEMKLQILQLRNIELEEKLKKSIFQEHESYMLGKIPSHFGERNLANIFLDKELDKYPSHDKMTLLEKLYYLEQQLSHCCKEKAVLQRKIDEFRLKQSSTSTFVYSGTGAKNKIASSFPSDTEHANVRKTVRDGSQSEKSVGRQQLTEKPQQLTEKPVGRQQLTEKPVGRQQLTDKTRPIPEKSSQKQTENRDGCQNSLSNKSELRKNSSRQRISISRHEAALSSQAIGENARESIRHLGVVSENETELNGTERPDLSISDTEELELEDRGSDPIDDGVIVNDVEDGYENSEAVRHQKHDTGKGSVNAKYTRTSKAKGPPRQCVDTTREDKDRKKTTYKANGKKISKNLSSTTSVSSGVREKYKSHKYVRISEEGNKASDQAQEEFVDIDDYSSVDSTSDDEDVNANRSLGTYDEEEDMYQNTTTQKSSVKSNRVAMKTTEQPMLKQAVKSRAPFQNPESASGSNQLKLGKRSSVLKTSISSENKITKAKPSNYRVTDTSANNKARQFQVTGHRDKNAKVKSTISSRGKGSVSSVITTAARVEDFEDAFHDGMEVSEDEGNLAEEMEYEEEQIQDKNGRELDDYEDETNDLESYPDEQLKQHKARLSLSRHKEESAHLAVQRQRHDDSQKNERVGVKSRVPSKKPNQLQEPQNRGASHTTSMRTQPNKFDSTEGSKSVLLEDDEERSDVSYDDDDDDPYVGDVIPNKNSTQQRQLYGHNSERREASVEPNVNKFAANAASSERGIARGSKSDVRLPKHGSASDAVTGSGSRKDEMEPLRVPARQFQQLSKTSRPSATSLGHSSQAKVSDTVKSHGISAVQEPSLLSISEFEKENSDYDTTAALRVNNRGQQPGSDNPSHAARYDHDPQLRRNLEQEVAHSQLDSSSYRTHGEGDNPNKSYVNPYHENFGRDTGRQGIRKDTSRQAAGKGTGRQAMGRDIEIVDQEYGRGRSSDGGDTTVYGAASDSSQSRRPMRDVPVFPMHRKSNSQLSLSHEVPSFDEGRNSGFNTQGKTSDKGYSLRSIGVNTEEGRQFGLPWEAKLDDSQEKKQLLDKIATLQRKMEELQADSSRHQLKSFELQGELERTKHLLQREKQERELATSELRRAQDRNSETSARLLMNSSIGSDPLRRGATPMEMEREVANLRAALASLDRDKDEMRVELDRKDEKLSRVMQDSSQYMDELSQLKLRLKNADLQISHTGESAKEQNREVEFLKKQLENNRRDLEKIIRERDDALKELHKISGAHTKGQMERRSVESELELKSKEADDLRKQVQRYIDEVRRIEELLLDKEEEMDMLIQHYRSLTVENSNLEAQRTNLEKEASSIRESVKDTVGQNIGFKTQLASQNALVQSLEEEIQRFTQQISQLENQLGSKAEREEMLAQDSKASKDLLYRLEVQMDKLKLDLADSESKRKQLEVENAELAAHIASMETRLHDETDRQQQLEALVANSREKDYQNERTALNISRERDELAEKFTSLQQRSETLNGEVSRYRLKSIELQNELDRTRRQLDSEKRDRDSAISELKRAREHLHSSSADYLLKSALGSSGLQSEGSLQQPSPSSGSTVKQNLPGSSGEEIQRSSRERSISPFQTPHAGHVSDLQIDTPPNATSTSRYEEKPEYPSSSNASGIRSSNHPPDDDGFENWDSPN